MDSKVVANKQTVRPDPRPAMAKEEDPRDRAARRAAEIRGHLGSMDDGVDEFAAPEPPPGWSYEWKRKLTLGAEEPSHMVALTRMGWEPVPASRHPEMMPSGGNYVHIERKGMILMERPKELVDEAREIERRRALGLKDPHRAARSVEIKIPLADSLVLGAVGHRHIPQAVAAMIKAQVLAVERLPRRDPHGRRVAERVRPGSNVVDDARQPVFEFDAAGVCAESAA